MIPLDVANNTYVRYGLVFAAGAFITFLVLPSGQYSKEEYLKLEKEIQTSYESKLEEKQKEIDSVRSSSQESLTKLQNEKSRRELELTTKINTMVSENSSLKTSTTKVFIEIRRPDGTVERRTTSISKSESESMRVTQVRQESEQKLKETTDKLNQEHATKIATLESNHQSEKQTISSELSKTQELLKQEQQKYTSLTMNKKNFSLGMGKKLDSTNSFLAEYDFYGPIFAGSIVDMKGTRYDNAGLFIGLRF